MIVMLMVIWKRDLEDDDLVDVHYGGYDYQDDSPDDQWL